MLGDKVWLAVGVSVHPKGVGPEEVRALCRTVNFFHTKPFLCGPGFVHGAIVVLKQERDDTNYFCRIVNTLLSKISLYVVALRFPLIGTKYSSIVYSI